MMVQAQEEMGGGSANPTDPHHTPTFTQPSTSQPQKKHKPRKPRKDTKIPQSSGPTDNVVDKAVNKEMDDSLERAATIATRLDVEQDMKDSSKKGKIDDIDANEDIYLVNVHRDEDMFGVNNLEGDEVIVETEVDHEVVVETEVASKDVNLSVDEVTLAQALAALKSAKPKADKVMLQELEKGTITTTIVATTVTAASTRPKAKGLVIHEEEQATTPTVSSQQPSQVKVQDKDKAQMLAELEEVDRLVRQREEEANIISWDNVQAMIDADYQMEQTNASRRSREVDFKGLIEVVPNKEDLAIDAIPLATKPSSIVDYKIHKEGKKTYYQIIRADGSSDVFSLQSYAQKL
ncbi:hypothetical protein Tco_1367662 [Tanacetum coccineum]